jgi:hypothetical protein
MNSVHGIQVAGATFPATIWHDFMSVAHGTDCNSFPPPTQPAQFSAFYGDHAANGLKAGKGGLYRGGTGGTGGTGTGGNGGTGTGTTPNGYNPNLYATPPQGPPPTVPPPRNTPHHGGGNGGGPGTGTGNGGNGGTGKPRH